MSDKNDIILIMDTTRDELFLALIVGGVEHRLLVQDCNCKHSCIMLTEIDKLLKQSNIDIMDVNVFALSVGPGSFTGIRIGITTVKGFLYANKKAKVISVNSLEADAYNHLDKTIQNVSIIDAKHNNAFYAEYAVENGRLIEKEIGFTTADKVKQKIESGSNVTSPYENSIGVNVTENYYDGFVNLILEKHKNNEFSTETFSPLYLKKSQAEEEADGNC